MTNAPVIINAFGDLDFVFNTKYDFKERFDGEPDYFANKGEQKGLLLDTNFVADAINLPLFAAKERGAGGGHIRFTMAKGSMNSHISQFPIGTLQEGARARARARTSSCCSGEGFSLMWPEGEEPQRYEWQEGTMIVPPNMWFHQHFNTGTTPARYLAFKAEGVAIRNAQGVPKAWISQARSAATRSTTPTSARKCASGSPTRSPSTASSRTWTRPTPPSARRRNLPQKACISVRADGNRPQLNGGVGGAGLGQQRVFGRFLKATSFGRMTEAERTRVCAGSTPGGCVPLASPWRRRSDGGAP